MRRQLVENRNALIEEVARAIHFVTYGREPTEPYATKGGFMDPNGTTYRAAVAAVHAMEHFDD